MTPAIFLDKDGTLLQDVPYNIRPDLMRFASGAFTGLARLATLGLPLIVITNQAGVALGKFTVDELVPMREHLRQMFELAGAQLDGFYFCPHHPDGIRPGYSGPCVCRKPAPGLLHIAAQRHGVDLASSWFVGDILDDVEAGARAGCQTILLDNGNETQWRKGQWREPQHVEFDLDGASRWIAAQHAASMHRKLA